MCGCTGCLLGVQGVIFGVVVKIVIGNYNQLFLCQCQHLKCLFKFCVETTKKCVWGWGVKRKKKVLDFASTLWCTWLEWWWIGMWHVTCEDGSWWNEGECLGPCHLLNLFIGKLSSILTCSDALYFISTMIWPFLK